MLQLHDVIKKGFRPLDGPRCVHSGWTCKPAGHSAGPVSLRFFLAFYVTFRLVLMLSVVLNLLGCLLVSYPANSYPKHGQCDRTLRSTVHLQQGHSVAAGGSDQVLHVSVRNAAQLQLTRAHSTHGLPYSTQSQWPLGLRALKHCSYMRTVLLSVRCACCHRCHSPWVL